MSATEQMAAMLNELMGPRRNAAPGENIELRYDDDEVCKFFLAAYCPNEMFTNTKADLGVCNKLHDEGLRKLYKDSDRFERLGYEDSFMMFIKKMHNDMQKKIKRNKDRLAITQPGACLPDEENKIKLEDQVETLTEKINECMEKAEKLGAMGKIDESQEVVKQADKFKNEREQLKRILLGAPASGAEDGISKPMEVCEICGCFLIVGDAQQRIDEHYVGKQHVGFAKIKATIEEMERRIEEKEKKRRQEREETDRRREKEREKDRDRRRGGDIRDRRHVTSTSTSSRTSRERNDRSAKDKDRRDRGDHRPGNSSSTSHRRSRSPRRDRGDKDNSRGEKDNRGEKDGNHRGITTSSRSSNGHQRSSHQGSSR